jgi:hypothetical protein
VILDIARSISHSDMDEVIPMHVPLLLLHHFIRICGEHLLLMEFELHVFIIEHLSEHIALVEINQAKCPFAKFYLNPVHLDLLFNFVDDFVI